MAAKRAKLWGLWGLLTMLTAGALAASLWYGDPAEHPALAQIRKVFLPGETTAGHYQIELACGACHSNPFGGRESMQESCVGCHGAALKEARDSHPQSKFTDPRNAERVAKLDATQCVTCHVEHRPVLTAAMGVTLPQDFCAHCHSGENDIAKERPTHKGLGFETCGSAGCHNFHDNRALYEDFLEKHLQDAMHTGGKLPARNLREFLLEAFDHPAVVAGGLTPLTAADADAPPTVHKDAKLMDDWLGTTHANAGINCKACHAPKEQAWTDKPKEEVCATCHTPESKGFREGKHGMRLAQSLSPMAPGEARLPMKADAHDTALCCTTCHSAHRFDTRRAAVESCLGCHDDTHSKAYLASPHYKLWQREIAGETPAGSGVSCASCHMPRIEHRESGNVRKLVQHNQSDSLRPNEKMLRPVCLECHGLEFSVNALADRALVDGNYASAPATKVRSFEMMSERLKEIEARKRRRAEGAQAQ